MIPILTQVAIVTIGIFYLGTYVEAQWRRWKYSTKQLLDKCLLTGTLGLTGAIILSLCWRYYTNLLAVLYNYSSVYFDSLNIRVLWLDDSKILEHLVLVKWILLACPIMLVLRIAEILSAAMEVICKTIT